MQIRCSGCSTAMAVPPNAAGKAVRCPKCQTTLQVPASGSPGPAGSKSSAAGSKPGTGKLLAACPNCSKKLQVPATAAGKQVKCPGCATPFTVPAAKGTPAASAPARPAAPAKPATRPSTAAAGSAGTAAGSTWTPPWETQPANPNPSFLDELTDADMSPVQAVKKPGLKAGKSSNNDQKLLSAASEDYRKENASSHQSYINDAKKQIWQSIGIYALLGLLQAGFGVFFLLGVEKEAEFLALDGLDGTSVEDVLNILRIAYVLKICLGVCFYIAASCFMTLPMTAAISAIVVFVFAEILSLIFNPFLLINVRAWIFRAAVLGALIQAVNNASYFRFIKGGGREKDDSPEAIARRKAGNKFGQKAITSAIAASIAVVATFGMGAYYIKRCLDNPLPEIAKLDASAPEGFDTYRVKGVSVYLPRARPIEPTPGVLESKGVITPLGTIFIAGVADIDETPLNEEAFKSAVERVTGGEYRRVRDAERDGKQGDSGVLTKATRFAAGDNKKAPMLNVEVFQNDGRIIIIGVAQEISNSSNTVVGSSAEPELEEVFWESIKIGPKPTQIGFWPFN